MEEDETLKISNQQQISSFLHICIIPLEIVWILEMSTFDKSTNKMWVFGVFNGIHTYFAQC